MTMLRSVLTIGSWTMASRILGFARDMLIASRLGAGPVADAFFVALKLPNLFPVSYTHLTLPTICSV